MTQSTKRSTKSAKPGKKLALNKHTLKNLTVRDAGPVGGRMKLTRKNEECL